MRTITTKAGESLVLVTRAELEAAPGYRAKGTRARSSCILHGGDNPTALEIDLDTGWANCHTRGCRARIVEDDRIDAYRGSRPASSPAPRRTPPPDPGEPVRLANLARGLEAAAAALPGSPGERYLASRGFSLELAQAHGLGWIPLAGGWDIDGSGKRVMRERVVFPLHGPRGELMSAQGRAIDPATEPRYYTLPKSFARKGWFRGGAIATARATRRTLWICEGPFDALALLAGGVECVVACLGVKDARPEWVMGVERIVVAFDTDTAGQAERLRWLLAAQALGIDGAMLPAAALEGCGDLADYWAKHRRLPALVEQAIAAERASGPELPALEPELDEAPRLEAPGSPESAPGRADGRMSLEAALAACEGLHDPDGDLEWFARTQGRRLAEEGPDAIAAYRGEIRGEVEALPAGLDVAEWPLALPECVLALRRAEEWARENPYRHPLAPAPPARPPACYACGHPGRWGVDTLPCPRCHPRPAG